MFVSSPCVCRSAFQPISRQAFLVKNLSARLQAGRVGKQPEGGRLAVKEMGAARRRLGKACLALSFTISNQKRVNKARSGGQAGVCVCVCVCVMKAGHQ